MTICVSGYLDYIKWVLNENCCNQEDIYLIQNPGGSCMIYDIIYIWRLFGALVLRSSESLDCQMELIFFRLWNMHPRINSLKFDYCVCSQQYLVRFFPTSFMRSLSLSTFSKFQPFRLRVVQWLRGKILWNGSFNFLMIRQYRQSTELAPFNI